MKSIKISRYLAKPLLWLSQFFNDNYFVVVCKGYDEDDEYYTGLYWPDDRYIDSSDEQYSDFQLWFTWKARTYENIDLQYISEQVEIERLNCNDPREVLSALLRHAGLSYRESTSIALDWGIGTLNAYNIDDYINADTVDKSAVLFIIALVEYQSETI